MRIFCSNEVIPSSPVSFPNGLPYCLAFQDLSDLQERSLPNRGWNIVIPEGAWKTAILVGCGGTQACQPYLHSRRRQRCEVGLIYPVSFGPARATSETLSQKRWKDWKKERRKEPCCAQLEHSTRHPLSLCGTGFGYPYWSSLAIPAIRSFRLLPVSWPWHYLFTRLDSRHTILSFSLNSLQSIGIFQTLVCLRTTVKKRFAIGRAL